MARTALLGFIAGVLATLVFHQGTIWLYHLIGLPFPFGAWNMRPNAYGAPAVLALSFWAGVWGELLAVLLAARPTLPARLAGFVLGAIVVGLAFWVEFRFEPPLWVHVVIWPLVTFPLAILLMRPMKAALVALQFAHRRREMGL